MGRVGQPEEGRVTKKGSARGVWPHKNELAGLLTWGGAGQVNEESELREHPLRVTRVGASGDAGNGERGALDPHSLERAEFRVGQEVEKK